MMDYNVGDVVAQTPFGGGVRYVRVTSKDQNIKNGRPGFDGILVYRDGTPVESEYGVWGYDDQITEVIKGI